MFRTRLSAPISNRQKIRFDKSELSEGLDLDKYYTSYIEPPQSLAGFLRTVLYKHLKAKIKEFKDAKFGEVFFIL
jgi:hypothetical protein